MGSPINLYAEFLLNIRQVTLYATLHNRAEEEAKAFVLSDRKSITVTYAGESSTITYPSGISGDATIHLPISKMDFISLRLKVTEEGTPHSDGLEVANDSPWPAQSLGPETTIACRHCRAIIVHPRPRKWQDLPRSDWAEMMDFWHCHKPASGDRHSCSQSAQYMDRPSLLRDTGFVDTGHIILPEPECSGTVTQGEHFVCSACSSYVGFFDDDLDGIRMYKWSILVQRSAYLDWERNDAQNFVCAQLLEAMDRQAVRKFMTFFGDLRDATSALQLWVFNPDLKYSASSIDNGRPRRAMKVLFKHIDNPTIFFEQNSNFVDEFPLPSEIFHRLQHDLASSNELIPLRAQVLQGWKVGLLDRFDPSV